MTPDDVLEPELDELDPESALDASAGVNRERAIEAVLLAVLAVVATYIGTGELLRALHSGHVSPTVAFPVLVLAAGWLAWRRSPTP